MQTQLVSRASSRVVVARGQRSRAPFAAPRVAVCRGVVARGWEDEDGPLAPLNQWPDPDYTAAVLEAFPDQGLGECFMLCSVHVCFGLWAAAPPQHG